MLPQDDKKSFHREEFGLVGDFKGGHFLHFFASLHLGWVVSVDETVGVKISLSNWLELKLPFQSKESDQLNVEVQLLLSWLEVYFMATMLG